MAAVSVLQQRMCLLHGDGGGGRWGQKSGLGPHEKGLQPPVFIPGEWHIHWRVTEWKSCVQGREAPEERRFRTLTRDHFLIINLRIQSMKIFLKIIDDNKSSINKHSLPT